MSRAKLFSKWILAALAMLMILNACAPSSAPIGSGVPSSVNQPGLPKIDPQQILSEGRAYYNARVNEETKLSQLHFILMTAYNTYQAGIQDLVLNRTSCFKDAAAAEALVGHEVMTKDGDAGTLINMLNTQSVTGNSSPLCAGLSSQIANFIIGQRAAIQDAQNNVYIAATNYQNNLSNFPEIAWMNDLMQTYGSTTVVYQKLAEVGIHVSDWSWVPTKNLKTPPIMGAKDQCQYYLSQEYAKYLPDDTKVKFEGHEDSLKNLYEVAWNPSTYGGKGDCVFFRFAAVEFMTRPIISVATGNTFATGIDQTGFPTMTP